MRLVELGEATPALLEQCAELLVEEFRETAPGAWPTLESARAEVGEALAPGKVGLLLRDGDRLVAWVGAQPMYDGHVWEVHPLVVRSAEQRRGHGSRLLREIERRAAAAGVSTLWLGADDEVGATSLAGRDLYADPYEAMRRVRNLAGHPFEFYRKCGFTLVGVVPDANGPGKPDLLLAKRVDPLLS